MNNGKRSTGNITVDNLRVLFAGGEVEIIGHCTIALLDAESPDIAKFLDVAADGESVAVEPRVIPGVENTRHGLQFRCECLAGLLGLMPFSAEIATDLSTYTVSLACRSCDRITKITFPLDEQVSFQRQVPTHV